MDDIHTQPLDMPRAIEALLFVAGEPVRMQSLAKQLNVDVVAITRSLQSLEQRLLDTSGLVLVRTEDFVSLATAPGMHSIVAAARAQTLEHDVGSAGLEVIALVLYRGPSTRATIDHIRGVNSTYTIRNLLARGLLERVVQEREYLYRPTAALLAHIGISKKDALPKNEELVEQLAAFETRTKGALSSTSQSSAAAPSSPSVVYEHDPNEPELS